LPTRELGVALSSVPVRCRPPLTCQPLFGEPTPESSLGGDLLLGFSVFRSAAGMPMAVRGWYMPWCRCKGSADVVRGDVGETFMGVFTVDPFGEYWVDLRYAWCWYGACCGMAVAVENWVAMAGRGLRAKSKSKSRTKTRCEDGRLWLPRAVMGCAKRSL
jgi:hypothetical protein